MNKEKLAIAMIVDDPNYAIRVSVYESGHFYTQVKYTMLVGIPHKLELLAIVPHDYPEQPGIVIGTPMIDISEVPGIDDYTMKDEERGKKLMTTCYQIRNFLAGHAAENLYMRSLSDFIHIGDILLEYFDKTQGGGDVLKAMRYIHKIYTGLHDVSFSELYELYRDELHAHFIDALLDIQQDFEIIEHSAKVLMEEISLDVEDLHMLIADVESKIDR